MSLWHGCSRSGSGVFRVSAWPSRMIHVGGLDSRPPNGVVRVLRSLSSHCTLSLGVWESAGGSGSGTSSEIPHLDQSIHPFICQFPAPDKSPVLFSPRALIIKTSWIPIILVFLFSILPPEQSRPNFLFPVFPLFVSCVLSLGSRFSPILPIPPILPILYYLYISIPNLAPGTDPNRRCHHPHLPANGYTSPSLQPISGPDLCLFVGQTGCWHLTCIPAGCLGTVLIAFSSPPHPTTHNPQPADR